MYTKRDTLNESLQHTATRCNTLQHTPSEIGRERRRYAKRNARKWVVSYTHNTRDIWMSLCNTLQHNAKHCSTQQHPAKHCNTLQHTRVTYEWVSATHCQTLQHTTTHCNTLIWNVSKKETYICTTRTARKCVVSRMNGPCHVWTCHVTDAWVMSRVNESCFIRTCEWVMFHANQ